MLLYTSQARYRYVEDLAAVWGEWVEMELRHKNYRQALELAQRCVTVPLRPQRFSAEQERALPVQERLYRCGVWRLCGTACTQLCIWLCYCKYTALPKRLEA